MFPFDYEVEIITMNEVGMNEEWRALKLRAEYLRNRCADEFEEYMHLVNCVGPNLESAYMVEIGQYEHRVFQLKVEIQRWHRRFALRQQALNRGEVPDLVQIEKILDGEFNDYMEQIRAKRERLKEAARNMAIGKLSEEENTAIRINYLNAVKKLHPDINHSLPESAKELWSRIQKAYAEKDWKELQFLSSMVDDVVGAAKDLIGCSSTDELNDEIKRLELRLKEISSMRVVLDKRMPFCFKTLLEDAAAIEQRVTSLKKDIAALENAVEGYERLWNGKDNS